MKLTNGANLFVVIYLTVMVFISVEVNTLCSITQENIYLNSTLDDAIFHATVGLVEYDTAGEMSINKDRAVDVFYGSLASGLGLSRPEAEELSLYVPVILVVCNDGFYINYGEVVQDSEGDSFLRHWTDKIPFSATDANGYVYSFFIGEQRDFVCVADMYSSQVLRGHYLDIAGMADAEYLVSEAVFDNARRNAVMECITRQMEYYINQHNIVAERFGVRYSFYLPSDSYNQWIRTIDDVSILLLFQGYPYKSSGVGYYNRVAFAGARLYKGDSYYMQPESGLYHRPECPSMESTPVEVYATREECASKGAYPCEECAP